MKPILAYAIVLVVLIAALAIYGLIYSIGIGGTKPPLWGAEGGYIVNILGIAVLIVGALLGWAAIKRREGGKS